MSEEQTLETPQKKLDPRLRIIILAGLVVLVLFIVSLAYSIRGNQMRTAAHLQGIDALSVALTRDFRSPDPDLLRQFANDIARTADYQSVTFTDANGKVLASTNRLLIGETLSHLEKPEVTPHIRKIDGFETVYRAIALGNTNVIGGVSIQLKP